VDTGAILAQQVDAMLDDLVHAQRTLRSVALSAYLTQRVGHDYTAALEAQRKRCQSLQQRLANGEETAEVWEGLRALRPATGRLLSESLALIHGSLARDAGVGVAACNLADALLDDLETRLPVRWRRFTVLAESELISGPADIIRMRFPEATVWSLPIVAHELGHFVARELWDREPDEERTFPIMQMLEREAQERDPYAARQLEETFADVFATWTIGPAYAMSCLCLHFDPTSETDPFDEHPGDVARMEVILRALERANELAKTEGEIVARLRATWDACLGAAGEDAVALTRSERDLVESRVDALHALLERHVGRALYRGWHRAEELVPELAEDDALVTDAPELEPWDVINAGWRCRLDVPAGEVHHIRRLGERTAELCRRRIEART
jgi:hypothetical protein